MSVVVEPKPTGIPVVHDVNFRGDKDTIYVDTAFAVCGAEFAADTVTAGIPTVVQAKPFDFCMTCIEQFAAHGINEDGIVTPWWDR